jgi:serine/threonine protein kinase
VVSSVVIAVLDESDPLTHRALSRIGQTLRGKWRLDRLLGMGGMACVYEGTHRNGMRGAVKVLHPDLSHDKLTRSRFLREGYVANQVAHPGVVKVLDDDVTEDGSVFLVMELLEGETVGSIAAARPGRRLATSEALDIADQLLDVLATAHDKGIVHRDIKPDNLFWTREQRLKVLDFGIARVCDPPPGATDATKTGTVFGTPSFMPPEQALGEMNAINGQSDVFSVGATLFMLLSGARAREGDTANKQLLAAMTKPPPPLTSVMADCPPALAAIVDRALAFEQKDRFADARSMQESVRAFAKSFQAGAGAPALEAHPAGEKAPPSIQEGSGQSLMTGPAAAHPTVPIVAAPVSAPPALDAPPHAVRSTIRIHPDPPRFTAPLPPPGPPAVPPHAHPPAAAASMPVPANGGTASPVARDAILMRAPSSRPGLVIGALLAVVILGAIAVALLLRTSPTEPAAAAAQASSTATPVAVATASDPAPVSSQSVSETSPSSAVSASSAKPSGGRPGPAPSSPGVLTKPGTGKASSKQNNKDPLNTF